MRILFQSRAASPPGIRASGFTVIELSIALALGVLVIGAGLVFSEGAGRTLVSITSQSTHNQSAGNGTEVMIQRIRAANTASVDVAGITLTLGFDDNPDVDSDGDKVRWNDRDHFEEFKFLDGDGSLATLVDNKITYRPDTRSADNSTIVPAQTRKLTTEPIFSIVGNTTVLINFGLLTTNSTPFSQAVEIRTKAVLRNRLH